MLLDFDRIPARRRPNGCLACPAAWQRADADLTTPVFAVPVARLREAVVAIAARAARTNLMHLDKAAMQAEFEQRSRVFGFPDTITVAFEAVGGDAATLAIYSRARHGIYDFGVNRRRVQGWLAALRDELPLRREAT